MGWKREDKILIEKYYMLLVGGSLDCRFLLIYGFYRQASLPATESGY
jgi:hypothetical protein